MGTLAKDGRSWFALRVQTKYEGRVSTALRSKGFDEFPALCRVKRKWADRIKETETALFPGYVFCRFNPGERLLPILTTPGVMMIVGAGSLPIAIPDNEIRAIQTVVQSGLPVVSAPYHNVGSRVSISAGPLAGIEGIVSRTDKRFRIAVSVELLSRSVLVEVERDWVSPVASYFRPHLLSSAATI